MTERELPMKIGLVGAGMVGASFAYALLQRGVASELVLVDVDAARAEGEAMDLSHGLPFVRPMLVRAGTYADLVGCAVVVMAAGANSQPGESRLDLLQKNAPIFREIVPQVVAANPEGILVIATNPVDILTYIAAEVAGLAPGRIIGSGTVLDTARFRSLLGARYGVDSRNVHAFIIGEHGDSEVPVWSLANIAGVPLRDWRSTSGQGYDRAALDAVFEETRTAAYKVIERKKATYYAIGLGLLAIVEAIVRDQHTVLTVSSPLSGQHGVEGMAVSLPAIIGRQGIEAVLELPLSSEEQAAFQQSAQLLKDEYVQLA